MSSRQRWILVVCVALTIVGGIPALYLAGPLGDRLGHWLDRGADTVHDARLLAQALQGGTLATEFTAHTQSIEGASLLQVAVLHRTEVLSRTDSAKLPWSRLNLPDVVLELSVPVEIAYTLDLNAPWSFKAAGEAGIEVAAPPLRFNTPAADVSALRVKVVQGSVWRDENAAKVRLLNDVTPLLAKRAEEAIPQVREEARAQAERLVRRWAASAYPGVRDLTVRLRFSDEPSDAVETPESPR